jgi:hypothetical protein
MTASAAKYDLTSRNSHPIEQGATFQLQMTFYEDKAKTILTDFTGYTAIMHIRDDFDSDDVFLELTTEGPLGTKITLGGTLGTVLIDIHADTTVDLRAPFFGVYDIKAEKPGVVDRLIGGPAEVTPCVTR